LRPSSAGQYTVVKTLGVGIAPTVRVVAKESVDSPLGTERLSKVLGKLVAADTELILSPVGVARDRLRSFKDPDIESVGKVGARYRNGQTRGQGHDRQGRRCAEHV
jgi:hypothetical protein